MTKKAKKVPFDPKVFLATTNGGRSLSADGIAGGRDKWAGRHYVPRLCENEIGFGRNAERRTNFCVFLLCARPQRPCGPDVCKTRRSNFLNSLRISSPSTDFRKRAGPPALSQVRHHSKLQLSQVQHWKRSATSPGGRRRLCRIYAVRNDVNLALVPQLIDFAGAPYGNRTRVSAVKGAVIPIIVRQIGLVT
jgi:hypothetical protein